MMATVYDEKIVARNCRAWARREKALISDAAPPELANELYERFKETLYGFSVPVKSGIFQAMMAVSIENDGPITILLDTKKAF
ncbi:MAG: D-aminoacyl-tRNA deacylase [Armatimonadetes bacterium]|nr:D-aminoacyl-tRNA deacylase [Armatimonadota bacterium]